MVLMDTNRLRGAGSPCSLAIPHRFLVICFAPNFSVRRCSLLLEDDCEILLQPKSDDRQGNCEMQVRLPDLKQESLAMYAVLQENQVV